MTVAVCIYAACMAALAAQSPNGLLAERLVNPVGMQESRPRLSWRLPDGVKSQSAYEIEADGVSSGKISGESSIDVPWPFAPLESSQRVSWRVRVWDENGAVGEWSNPAGFVAGVMKPSDWSAKWIAQNSRSRPDVDFALARWVEAERVVIAFDWFGEEGFCDVVAGVTAPFDMTLNGRKVSSPCGQVYDWRRLAFRDLRRHLVRGRNILEIALLPEDKCANIEVRGGKCPRAIIALVRLPGFRAAWSEPSTDASWTSGIARFFGFGHGDRNLGFAHEPEFSKHIDFSEELHSPAFAKTFRVAKDVKKATLHVTGLGFCEASINGQRIGEKVLDPSPTDYSRRVLYSTYVLDGLVRPGVNELCLLVGHGWYDVRAIDSWNFEYAPWRGRPVAFAQLELEYADGSKGRVVTDGTWREVSSPVWYDCIREGCVIGAPRSVLDGLVAVETDGPGGVLEAETIPPAKVVREFAPTEITETPRGEYVVRFPETISGWTRIRFKNLAKGQEIAVRYDENVSPSGSPGLRARTRAWSAQTAWDRVIDIYGNNWSSYRFISGVGAFQTDHYVASGLAEEFYEPKFTYAGFNSVVVSGLGEAPRREDVVARFVRSDFPKTGSFTCSDATLTELVRMAENSYQVNFTDGIPTDCPHREKLGWTGDAWIASEVGQLFFENTACYRKWLVDIYDTQRDDGSICAIAPTCGWGYRNYTGPVFDAVLATLPWNLWRYRADRVALERGYGPLKKWIAYERGKMSSDGLVSNGLGDWNAPDRSHMPPTEYVVSAAFYNILTVAAETAKVLGEDSDGAKFAEEAVRLKGAINAKYYHGDGLYANGGQTAQALAAWYDFAPEADRSRVAARLVEVCEEEGGKVDFGLYGSKHVLRALGKICRVDVALRMLLRKEKPGYAFWVGKSSTLWEDFNNGLSKAHVMLGDFAAWAQNHIAGIEPTEPGFRRFRIAPHPAAPLTWARGETQTPYGRILSSWRIDDGKFALELEVPPGTTADVVLPDGTLRAVDHGKHSFSSIMTGLGSHGVESR